jgi:hypothetical protein
LQLLFGDSGFSADGRMNVDSKGAANHEGGFELREFFQMRGDVAFGGAVEIHADGVAEIFWDEGANAHAERDVAKTALCEKEEDAG